MIQPLWMFIGYDAKEPAAFHVLSHSILERATCPLAIIPLKRRHIHRCYWRERGPTESTEFSLSRFIVPALCEFEGHAVFLDCDMLCQVDVMELWPHILANPDKAVLVCQHDYTPTSGTKFLGQPQTVYPRKNWSSFMVFNNARCKALTPEYVNTASGLDLHRFNWTTDDRVGELPLEWNWLVGEYPPNADAKMLHYTLGGPWFPGHEACDHADRWFAARAAMLGAEVTQPCSV